MKLKRSFEKDEREFEVTDMHVSKSMKIHGVRVVEDILEEPVTEVLLM